jgi:hypothetical protein
LDWPLCQNTGVSGAKRAKSVSNKRASIAHIIFGLISAKFLIKPQEMAATGHFCQIPDTSQELLILPYGIIHSCRKTLSIRLKA